MEYITNGSFEQIDSCYGNYTPIGLDVFEWSGCKGWSNPIKSSSDLWCYNGKMGNYSPPGNPPGYQYARTGNNFAGILISDVGNNYNYREYVQNKLTQALTIGKHYEINFYVSSNAGSCNISEIGIKFYNNKISDLTKLQLTKLKGNVEADVTNSKNNFIKDTLGWQKISLKYKATGNENFIVIGCFIDSLNLVCDYTCDTSGWIGQIFPGDYLFIDDVSITETPIQTFEFPNVFTPNNDLINDVWLCDLSIYANVSCNIYNRWGSKIYETLDPIIQWDGKTITGINCDDGVYYYCIQTEEKNYKGFIQLMR